MVVRRITDDRFGAGPVARALRALPSGRRREVSVMAETRSKRREHSWESWSQLC